MFFNFNWEAKTSTYVLFCFCLISLDLRKRLCLTVVLADRSTSTVKRGKIPMKMVKTAPLASQGEMLDEKTNVGIGIKRVELVYVARDNIENGQWRKNLRK